MKVIKAVFNNNVGFSIKTKFLLTYLWLSKRSRNAWKKRYLNNRSNGFIMTKSLSKSQMKEYKSFWGDFGKSVEIDTVQTCYSISGKYNKFIIPEDIFASDIEPSLNKEKNVSFLANKSFYNRWFPEGIFPKDFFHKIDNELLDCNLNKIGENGLEVILENLKFPVVVKPNFGTSGGKDVYFAVSADEVRTLASRFTDLVVQEKIVQHDMLNVICAESINSVRVCVYRSVKDGAYKVINASLRMGKDGSLDNETDGGIVCNIDDQGVFNKFAVDKYGLTYNKHPNSGFEFDSVLPFYDKLCEISILIASKIFYTRLVSLDLCLDSNGRWRVIEVNLSAQTIRFAQYAGKPFFGDYTEEVASYCRTHHWAL